MPNNEKLKALHSLVFRAQWFKRHFQYANHHALLAEYLKKKVNFNEVITTLEAQLKSAGIDSALINLLREITKKAIDAIKTNRYEELMALADAIDPIITAAQQLQSEFEVKKIRSASKTSWEEEHKTDSYGEYLDRRIHFIASYGAAETEEEAKIIKERLCQQAVEREEIQASEREKLQWERFPKPLSAENYDDDFVKLLGFIFLGTRTNLPVNVNRLEHTIVPQAIGAWFINKLRGNDEPLSEKIVKFIAREYLLQTTVEDKDFYRPSQLEQNKYYYKKTCADVRNHFIKITPFSQSYTPYHYYMDCKMIVKALYAKDPAKYMLLHQLNTSIQDHLANGKVFSDQHIIFYGKNIFELLNNEIKKQCELKVENVAQSEFAARDKESIRQLTQGGFAKFSQPANANPQPSQSSQFQIDNGTNLKRSYG